MSVFFLTSNTAPTSMFFFFNDTATTEIYTLSLHDALPICSSEYSLVAGNRTKRGTDIILHIEDEEYLDSGRIRDRKSTRLNSSHVRISYAVFCLKKKKKST